MLQQPGRSSHNRPVMRVRSHVAPLDWIDLILSTGRHTITVRIRQDNLYTDGYRMENGQWLEFNRENPIDTTTHLIPGSIFLGFTGSYIDLERVGNRVIAGMSITQTQVLNAVD